MAQYRPSLSGFESGVHTDQNQYARARQAEAARLSGFRTSDYVRSTEAPGVPATIISYAGLDDDRVSYLNASQTVNPYAVREFLRVNPQYTTGPYAVPMQIGANETVRADPSRVFDFVSEVNNNPQYFSSAPTSTQSLMSTLGLDYAGDARYAIPAISPERAYELERARLPYDTGLPPYSGY